jgi:Xaa-Pro dipeptidase
VLIGANSALPHGTTGEHTLQDGDFLLFDFGGTLNGYPADITRTFIYGTGNAQQAAMHDAVLRANAAGRAAIRPGISAGEVDAITRQVIVEAGFGEYFTHRTGHGLGLEVHELPNIAPNDSMILQAGMVFTIEPGVYLPALGGVRIEDNMVVTETGSESLTTFPREATL